LNWLQVALRQHAQLQPDKIALRATTVAISYGNLIDEVDALIALLVSTDAQRIGLLLDNSPAWALIDIACLAVGKTLIPVPAFFTAAQMTGLFADAGVDLLLTDQPARVLGLNNDQQGWKNTGSHELAGLTISWLKPGQPITGNRRQLLPRGTAKITYTSGSTGDPKGVCLSSDSLRKVATELAATMDVDSSYHHLCVLPLTVLLENVAGLYVALLAGTTCQLEPLGSLGWRGMSDFDFHSLAKVLGSSAVDSLILVPGLLAGLLEITKQQPELAKSLRLVAVGGAAVPSGKLAAAEQLGLPVYQGYGLSECGSVVAVNSPGANRLGSVGKVLAHQQLKIAEDGQIWLQEQGVLSYLGREQQREQGWWPTGDRCHLDSDGYLYIEGRVDNLLMTAYGRNVSPEWVEIQLLDQPMIQQAVLLGTGQRQLEALLVVANSISDDEIEKAVALANQNLPDYAQVGGWRRTGELLTLANGLLTGGGTPDRAAVGNFYGTLADQSGTVMATDNR